MGSPRDEFTWPMYFVKLPLEAPRVTLKVGDPFPLQNKFYIRGLAAAYGIENAEHVQFGDLPYVEIVDVANQEVAERILAQGLDLTETRRLLDKSGRKKVAA